MRVMITDKEGQEWWALCQGMFGHPLTPVEDYQMATAPAEYGRLCIFDIEDDSPLATWVQLKHPRWIEPAWMDKNKHQVIVDQDDYPFMEIIEDDDA